MIAFFPFILNLYFPAPVFTIVTSKKFSFYDNYNNNNNQLIIMIIMITTEDKNNNNNNNKDNNYDEMMTKEIN